MERQGTKKSGYFPIASRKWQTVKMLIICHILQHLGLHCLPQIIILRGKDKPPWEVSENIFPCLQETNNELKITFQLVYKM